jgi:hypothetical protein
VKCLQEEAKRERKKCNEKKKKVLALAFQQRSFVCFFVVLPFLLKRTKGRKKEQGYE